MNVREAVSGAELLRLVNVEYDAWLEVVRECDRLRLCLSPGANAGRLHDLIVRWGEELAQLRMADPEPEHAEHGLESARHRCGVRTA
jgi:hypothetical protein